MKILFRLIALAAHAAVVVPADTQSAADADQPHVLRILKRKKPKPVARDCKVTSSTNVAIYVGDGTGDSSKLWAEALVDFWKTGKLIPGGSAYLNDGPNKTPFPGDPSLDYVTLNTNEFGLCSASDLAGLDFFFMPGGSAYLIQDALGSAGKAKLTAYLDNGGSYVGMCAGGYYAARGYYWKGYDGAPTDNCKDKFCRYETAGTFSFSSATQDFTVHEWGGTSYHADLLAYGPLSQILVEGPIEEIAGPWNAQLSDPDAPYDSHLLRTDDSDMPYLRSVYWGGATERYLYTSDAAASSWGTEHAHFVTDAADGFNVDLDSPADAGTLWSLKSVSTNHGGKIIISSAHLEAALFHKGSEFGDGGMTECQQYNNYAYLIRTIRAQLGLTYNVPGYDQSCSTARPALGEVKSTAILFPDGLAFNTSPSIPTPSPTSSMQPSTGGGGGGGGPLLIDFENQSIEPFTLSGGAKRPWRIDTAAACDGTTYGVRAGHSGGVDSESYLTMTVPSGVSGVTYFYSHPSALDRGDDFHVLVNGVVMKSYEIDSATACKEDTVALNSGDTLQFKCESRGNGETCSVDQIQFF